MIDTTGKIKSKGRTNFRMFGDGRFTGIGVLIECPAFNLGLNQMKTLLFAASILLITTSARAQLTSEPAPGTLPAGQSVLVDDGTCGPGKIKKVTGGSDTNLTTGKPVKGGSGRKRTCIKKP